MEHDILGRVSNTWLKSCENNGKHGPEAGISKQLA